MKWYTCCNERGLWFTGDCLLSAAHSCLSRTRLEPHLVYEGRPNILTDYLAGLGVKVIFHRLSFADAIRNAPDRPGFDRDWAFGTFLRFDLALIEREDDVILYTDTDVTFAAQPSLEQPSGALRAAPEYIFEAGDVYETQEAFNAGVLVLNLRAFRELHDVMVRFTTGEGFAQGARGWYDQGVLNQLFRSHWDPLPQSANWRPFACPDMAPEIVHFHMLKPRELVGLEQGREAGQRSVSPLQQRAPQHYARAMQVFRSNFPSAAREVWTRYRAGRSLP